MNFEQILSVVSPYFFAFLILSVAASWFGFFIRKASQMLFIVANMLFGIVVLGGIVLVMFTVGPTDLSNFTDIDQ